ncbi:MAG: hypothetical protein HY276_06190 [Ignavibacteriales bacterium]|nr:hypothetical protein [Ignavibacteriales bacterium]
MNKIIRLFIVVLCILVSISLLTAQQQLKVEGKAEEYHQAMTLGFSHMADHAKALAKQTSLGRDLNMYIAKQHVDEIGRSLENVRTDHAMVHKTYSDAEMTAIQENHNVILDSHTKSMEAFKSLKAEVQKTTPDLKRVKDFSNAIYEYGTKALNEHREAMMKLGVR